MAKNTEKKKNNVVQLINALEKQIPMRELDEKEELDKLKVKLAVLKKYRKRFPVSDSERREISSILCFNNLGYCCKKECCWRNAVFEICKIDEKYFEAAKETLGFALISSSTSVSIGSKKNISESDIVEINKKNQSLEERGRL